MSGKTTFKDIIEIRNSTEDFNVEFECRARTKANRYELNLNFMQFDNYKFTTLADEENF